MLVISRAKISDVEEIKKLERRVWKEYMNLEDVTGDYGLGPLIRFGYVFVAKVDGKIVGVIVALKTKDSSVFVEDWVVDKNYRGQKIGRKLYEKLIEAVGNVHLVTWVNSRYVDSVEAHKKIGFKMHKIVKDPYGIGETEDYFVVKRKSS